MTAFLPELSRELALRKVSLLLSLAHSSMSVHVLSAGRKLEKDEEDVLVHSKAHAPPSGEAMNCSSSDNPDVGYTLYLDDWLLSQTNESSPEVDHT